MQAAIRPGIRLIKGGVILYDAAQSGKVHEHVFAPAYWQARDALGEKLGGRGAAWRIRIEDIDWILRFYRRGGVPGRFIQDRYFYTGLERTRPWREWRLLATMHALALPAPRPVAARVLRGGLGYRGALVMETVPGESLSHRLKRGKMAEDAWFAVGRCIRRFHDAGVWHADLNAHNILIDMRGPVQPVVHLVDFDRGRIRSQDTAWRNGNLSRLHRSLLKITSGTAASEQVPRGWAVLNDGYRDA